MLALFAGATFSALAGYTVAAGIYQDGKAGLDGVGYGYLLFILLSAFILVQFRRSYAAKIGSWLWAIGGLLLPIAAVTVTLMVG